MLHALGPGEIAHMHQTVDSFFDFDERAEVGHVAHATFYHAADAVTAIDRGPRVRLELLQPERNAPVLGMHFEDDGLHLIARLHYLRGMLHSARPCHLADVD